MSIYEAGEKTPVYYLDFYSGGTLVDSVSSSDIVDLQIQRNLIADKPTVGQANAGELDATFLKPSFSIPRMAGVNVRIVWNSVPYSAGWFYIDTRSENPTNNTLNIHCYDAMLMAEQLCPAYGTDINVIGSIATMMGVLVDSSVTDTITNAYNIPQAQMTNSARDVLKTIGAAYGGSFFITKDGKLGFAGLYIPAEEFFLVDEFGDPILFGGDEIIV